MKLAAKLSPRALAERVDEALWKAFPGPALAPVKLTWPVDRSQLHELTIRWPNERSYAWKPRKIHGDQVLAGLRGYLPVTETDLPQPYKGVVNFEVDRGGRTYRVAVEVSDYSTLNEDAYRDCDLHFKMQWAFGGYGERDHLLPGGYLNNDAAIYTYLPRLRSLRDTQPPRFEVYGRFGLNLDTRGRAIDMLKRSTRFRYFGGAGKVRYSRYLKETARAKVCVDLPGEASITFRFIDYIAIGTAIVCPPHTCQLHYPFEDGVHVRFCQPDYSDFEERCVELLEDEPMRRRLVANSRAFFDAYVHREQLASFYLREILARLR